VFDKLSLTINVRLSGCYTTNHSSQESGLIDKIKSILFVYLFIQRYMWPTMYVRE